MYANFIQALSITMALTSGAKTAVKPTRIIPRQVEGIVMKVNAISKKR